MTTPMPDTSPPGAPPDPNVVDPNLPPVPSYEEEEGEGEKYDGGPIPGAEPPDEALPEG